VVTDEQLNARLNDVYQFPPCDGWDHVRRTLRKGKIYVVFKKSSLLKVNSDRCFFRDGILGEDFFTLRLD
jgi:hypothetical protein